MRRFAAVSTCHGDGYERYGRRMVESFDRHWPKSIPLHFYVENFAPSEASPRVHFKDLHASSDDLVAFKKRHADNPRAHGSGNRPRWNFRIDVKRRKFKIRRKTSIGYRWDAVRFSHKVFALLAAVERCDADVLIFLDADTYSTRDIPLSLLEETIPEDRLVGYLGRPRDAETGFVSYNLRHPAIHEFFTEFGDMYRTDALFRERQWCDGYLFDMLRKRFQKMGHHSFDIARGSDAEDGHVFQTSPLGRYMTHDKGTRKPTVALND